jgi:hypothetical protein
MRQLLLNKLFGAYFMKKFILGMIIILVFTAAIPAMEHTPNALVLNGCIGMGTFSAGEYCGGSVFLGGSISLDWIPSRKIGLSYGLASGLLGGRKQENIIFGVPIIFRFGWYPPFFNFSKFDIFALAKIGWAFGIWGQNANDDSTSNGIVGGFNVGGRYKLNKSLGIYAEIGYNYYGLARNSNYPEYPLGYGSGKTYGSIGISYAIR